MKAETRKYSNVYWSFKEYLRVNLTLIKRYYNPAAKPKPTDVNKWIIFEMGISDLDLFSKHVPRIHCVSRQDTEGSNLIELVEDVLAVFDSSSTGRKYITFYDKDSNTVIGDIWINSLEVRPEVSYDTGIISRAIDIYSHVKTDRILRHG